MTALSKLEAARTVRDKLRTDFDARLATVRGDVAARGVGGRIADSATETAQDVIDEAIAVADEHRAVVAGTIVLLVVWFLRTPLMALVTDLIGGLRDRID